MKGKTNAMRILDSHSVDYDILTYDVKDDKIDAKSVSNKIGKPIELVYKTLVTIGHSKALYVFVIGAEDELDLKKAARAVSEKNVEMIAVKDINKFTGYIRGGCSPIGMKKQYETVLSESAKELDEIIISAGKIGMQVELKVSDLLEITQGHLEDIIK